ncbi:Uncharacterised protein [Bordetella pertussis]|nr:Uncharacterised protein [Bordetella pertussis]
MRQLPGLADGFVRGEEVGRPLGFEPGDAVGQGLHGALDGVAVGAVGPDDRAALGEIGGRKAQGAGQAGDARFAALELGQQGIHAPGGFELGAHAVDGNEERQAPRGAMPVLAGLRARLQQGGGARAGVGHVDVRIGAIGHQRAGMRQHGASHVGVQVQAGDDGRGGADGVAQAAQEFAFAVVVVFGDHGAVQVQVDGVVAAGAGGRLDLAGDTLEGVARDVRRGAGAGPEDGVHAVAVRQGRVQEAAGGDVDGAQRQQVVAAHQGGKAFAAQEVVIAGLGRREGVGFVLETGNQDMHACLPGVGRRRGAGRQSNARVAMTGAWSDGCSLARGALSMTQATQCGLSASDSSTWSMRRPALRRNANWR